MTKLSKDIRKAILADVVNRRFEQESKSIILKCKAFAEKLYNLAFTPEERKFMYSLPPGWLREQSHIPFYTSYGHYFTMPFSGAYSNIAVIPSELNVIVTKRVTDEKAGTVRIHVSDPALLEEWEKLHVQIQELNEKVSAAKTVTQAALNQCSTIKSLVQKWPEIEPFAKKYMKEAAPRQLPAIPTDTLNNLLDLPV